MTISQAFVDSWEQAISAYKKGEINSECTLQAFMYSMVRSKLRHHLVLCEPHLPIPASRGFFPDLVVLDDSSILAIAEFKFRPHHYPAYRSDLDKMQMLSSDKQSFYIALDPASGHYSSKTHRISEACLLVFGVVGRHDSEACDTKTLAAHVRQEIGRFKFLTHGCGNDP